jgi:nitrite reductase (NADH) large subunit
LSGWVHFGIWLANSFCVRCTMQRKNGEKSFKLNEKIIVVGNGMAGLRVVEEIVAQAPGRFDVTIAGEEPEPAYNRVLLSPLLAGEIGIADVRLKPCDWYAAQDIKLVTGAAVTALDATAKCVTLADGAILAFDRCVLATGSEPIRLPVPGSDLAGVEVFRTLRDIARLSAAASAGGEVAVIGGGLLGIEAAYGLKRAGAKVTLVHLMDRLMERQLDGDAAGLLKSALEAKGITVLLNAATEHIDGIDGNVSSLALKDGRTVPASLIVMAAGIKPRAALGLSAGLACGRGIKVDDRMETSAPGIFAIGECAEHRGAVYGLVEPAYEHARVVAKVLAGKDAAYTGTVLATNLKVSGVPVFSAGDFEGVGAEHIIWRDNTSGRYRKFVIRDDRLCGVVMIGDTTDALWYRELIRSGAPMAPIRASLPFGRAFAEAA